MSGSPATPSARADASASTTEELGASGSAAGDMSLASLASELPATPTATPISPLARQALQQWFLSVACVNFDLELGPDVEFMYPAVGISKEEKDNIAFSSFPDTAVFGDGNLVFSWRVREVPLAESSAPPPRMADGAAPSRMRSTRARARPERRSSLMASGAKLYRRASASGFLPRSSGAQAAKPAEQPPPTARSRSTNYIYGYTYFRQRRDPGNRRGYFQKSLVVLTHLPYVALFSEIVARVGPLFFEHGMPALESLVQEVVRWPAPRLGTTLSLPLLGSVVSVALPLGNEAQNGPWARGAPAPAPLLASVPTTPLVDTFEALLPSLWVLWECMLLAEPLLVLGGDPRSTSDAVWHLLDLVRPVPCAGDFRPYFHIHDYDYAALVTRNKPQAGTVLGVTNPFFLEACETWPHVVRLSAPRRTGSAVPGRSANSTPPAAGVGMATRRRRRVSRDSGVLREVQALAAQPAERVRASALLKRHFAELTERFLAPLNRYVATLIPTEFDLSSPAEPPRLRPFSAEAFLASLRSESAPLPVRSRNLLTGPAVRHTLYADFLQCPNFSLWLQARVAAAEEEQWRRRIAALSSGDVVAYGRANSEIERVDLYVRLTEEIRAIERQLASAEHTGPGPRWLAAENTGPPPPRFPSSSTSSRVLQTQKERLEQQLDRLRATLSEGLRRSLAAKLAEGARAPEAPPAAGAPPAPRAPGVAP